MQAALCLVSGALRWREAGTMRVETDTGQATEARQILLSWARGRSHREWMEVTLTTHVPFEDRLSCSTTPPG